MRRRLIAIVAGIAVVAGGFLAYGWWSRRGPISFSRGGRFGSSEPSPAARATGGPAPGRYLYRGTGTEKVTIGSLPACSWAVGPVALTVARRDESTVLDWEIGTRAERQIHSFRPDGVFLTYTASTVTCLGIRTTSEDDQNPPALRFRLPLHVGDSWATTSTTENRTERAQVTVERAESVIVPAGRFDAMVVHLKATLSGSQSGTLEATFWYAPRLDLWVKERFASRVSSGPSTFTARWEIDLESLPGASPD
ncbi:MAG: hypothetical protein HY775_01565 [Acidobacteria bacterium]|nr:hypothetical protein [Acidobacteriota bacterium]